MSEIFQASSVKSSFSSHKEEQSSSCSGSGSLISEESQRFYVFSRLLEKGKSAWESFRENLVVLDHMLFLSPGAAYADLSCERLGVYGTVFWDDTYEIYRSGIGQDMASRPPGFGRMILLSAHNTTHFLPLENAVEGDVFRMTTPYGEFAYEINRIEVINEFVLGDLLMEMVQEHGEVLVLYTCWPNDDYYGHKPDRLVLFGRKIEGPVVIAPNVRFVAE